MEKKLVFRIRGAESGAYKHRATLSAGNPGSSAANTRGMYLKLCPGIPSSAPYFYRGCKPGFTGYPLSVFEPRDLERADPRCGLECVVLPPEAAAHNSTQLNSTLNPRLLVEVSTRPIEPGIFPMFAITDTVSALPVASAPFGCLSNPSFQPQIEPAVHNKGTASHVLPLVYHRFPSTSSH